MSPSGHYCRHRRDIYIEPLKLTEPDVKTTITSGYFSDGPMSGYIDHGFKAYVTKPYNITDIRETLKNVINGTANPGVPSGGGGPAESFM